MRSDQFEGNGNQTRPLSLFGTAVALWLAVSLPAVLSAQENISGFVDSKGRVVFINVPADAPAPAAAPKVSTSQYLKSARRKLLATATVPPEPPTPAVVRVTFTPAVVTVAPTPAVKTVASVAPMPPVVTIPPATALPAMATLPGPGVIASPPAPPPPLTVTPSIPRGRDYIAKLVDDAARRHQVDAELVHAIVRVESNYNPYAQSNKGARGLMQLIPATARRFGVRNAFDPRSNLDGGIRYLKYLMGMFKGDLQLSLAAYNAGEMAVTRSGGVPPYRETRNYIRKINELYPMRSVAAAAGVAPEPQVVRYMDDSGVVHFSNTDMP